MVGLKGHYYIDACEIKMIISLRDIRVTTSSQSKLSYEHPPRKNKFLSETSARYDVNTNEVFILITAYIRGRRGRDRMVVGFTTTCAISAYYH